jgi:hypothetical protein
MKQIIIMSLMLLGSAAVGWRAGGEDDVVPTDKTEWSIKLNSPVQVVGQEMYNRFLPNEVFQIFADSLLAQVDYPAGWIKNRNQLPGNSNEWYLNSYFLCWPLAETEKPWNNEMDPKGYIYVVDYDRQLIALWFPDSLTLRCKKLTRPDSKDRQETVTLPRFKKAVEWRWSFRGFSYDASSLARGKIINCSVQYGYTEVSTSWPGGEEYRLPPARTTITADGQTVYSD